MRSLNHWIGLIFVVCAHSFGATLSGQIYSDKGLPVALVPVSIQSLSGGSTQQQLTDAQGGFSIAVPDGATYSVCTQSSQVGLLNSCEWALTSSLIQIPPGAASAKISITLQTGVVVRFRLSDAAGLIPPVGTPSGNAWVEIGVWDAGGQYHVAPRVSSDNLGHNLEILVPANVNFHVSVWASNLKVLDQNGKSVTGAPFSLNSAPANLGQTPVFSVTP